jgi:glucosamine kinase
LAVNSNVFLLGVDGGGTNCRARLTTFSGELLGEAVSGPANLRQGLPQTFAAVLEATTECLAQAGLPRADLKRTIACLALAGASEPSHCAAAESYPLPFGQRIITTDAHAACIGAHQGRDGAIVVVGTGTVGWAVLNGRSHRVGGWGLPLSDEGSAAWLGCEALRRVLWAVDGRISWTPLLSAVFAHFNNDPHAIVRWGQTASPRDFGSFSPDIVEHAARGDEIARELMANAATHVDALVEQLLALGAARLSIVGGLAPLMLPWLCERTRARVVEPAGDALQGALELARAALRSRAQVA